MTLEWMEPPDVGRYARTKHTPAAEELRANPMRWARLQCDGPNPDSLVQAIRSGLGAFAPKGAFQAAVRRREVYARYIGEPNKEAK